MLQSVTEYSIGKVNLTVTFTFVYDYRTII
jgi:hypothetical protein